MTEANHLNSPAGNGPWSALAHLWNRLECPLRPVPEDLKNMQSAWLQSLPNGPPGRRVEVLLLGVTPEFARFPWTDNLQLLAVDSSEAMLKAVWPGDQAGRRAQLGDWLHLPCAPGSIDLIICDNGPTLFTGLTRLTKFSRELHRVLHPEGRAVMKNLTRPEQPETLESITADLATGRVRNFHSFKMRYLMALQANDFAHGINLGKAWEQFQKIFPDRPTLARQIGCPLAVVDMIDAYRDRDAGYSFYTLEETARGFADFILTPGPIGHYDFADRCPVFSLTPRT